jgi:hypothetical protein
MMAGDTPPPFDPTAATPVGGETPPPFDPTAATPVAGAPQVGGARAALEGLKSGASAGWSDEITGLMAASGAAEARAYMPPDSAQDYEDQINKAGGLTGIYHSARDDAKAQREAAQTQHPYYFGAGELGGAGATMMALPMGEAAGLGARVAQGVRMGAGYGAVSGAAEGTREGGLPGAAIGAVTGGIEGGLGGAGGELGGSAIGKGLQFGYDLYGRPIASAVKGWIDPAKEAARRVYGALSTDAPQVAAGQTLGLTPAEYVAAHAAGQPVMAADLGGETTRALLRSAANTSPEGRAVIQSAVADRFAEQNDRAGSTIRSLVSGGADTAKTKAQLEAEYDAERGGAYGTAYEAGDRPIWSPELERLSSAPSVAGAIRGAVNRWQDFQVKDGFGAMNPPVNVTPDGQLKFLPGKGMLPYPNLQFWDYASRNLAGMAAQARRAGNNTDAGLYGGLEQQLKAELDKQVPEFAEARGIASRYFGGNNAIEAGQEALNFKGDIRDLQRTMAQMKPAEREIFQESYADAMARKAEGVSDNQDITNRIYNSPQERQRVTAVLGQPAADRLGAFVDRERVFDAVRKALGNSTTARQMIEAGLAGGAAGGYLTGDWRGAGEGFLGGMGARRMAPEAITAGFRSALGYVDRNTAKRVAELLTSSNPADIARGLSAASSNPRIGQALRETGSRASAMIGAREAATLPPSVLQLTGGAGAQNQQQTVPGPVQAQKTGGRIEQQRATGGKVGGESGHKGRLDPQKAPLARRANGGRVVASNIEHEPSEAQKEAGNYAKDHVRVHGLDITIENAKGHHRRGIGPDGKSWSVKIPSHYGYIKGTVGKDKDHVDVYLGPHLKAPSVWVLDQMNAESKKFDEHKTFIGFASKEQVVDTYRKAFSDGKAMDRLGHLTRMSVPTFKQWLESGNMGKTANDHFADAVKIDSTHDGPWMSCMSIDGKTMYRNKNIPATANIKGKIVDVDDMLLHHEVPERDDLESLMKEFEERFHREPNKNERKAIYLKAHNRSGTPNERAHAKKIGLDWKAWSAWCRGEEAKIERGPFTNQPKDADVKPIPHSHGDLEAVGSREAA